MRSKVDIDLLEYGDIAQYTPKLGDMIYRDGIFVRWWAVVTGISSGVNISIRKSGNMRLMVSGDYTEEVININKIRTAWVGSYIAISGGVCYV